MALTRGVLEPEVYNEDELFDESSDEEGDLLIQSAFEEEEVGLKEVKVVKVKGLKEVKVEKVVKVKVKEVKVKEVKEVKKLKEAKALKEVKVEEVKEVKVKIEGTTEPKENGKFKEAETLKEEVKEEAEDSKDSKDDIFNSSQNFMGSAPADAPLEERLKLEPADMNDACFTNIVKREIDEGKPLEPLVLPPGPEMVARSSSPTWATIIPLIGGSALGCKEVLKNYTDNNIVDRNSFEIFCIYCSLPRPLVLFLPSTSAILLLPAMSST